MQDDAAGGVQTVRAAAEGKFRFVPVFVGQGFHRFGVDIGRVGDDEVVGIVQTFEQIGVDEPDAFFQPVFFDIDGGDFEGVQTQVDGVDFGGGVVVRHLDGEAAAARAQIKCAVYQLVVFYPRQQRIAEQLVDERTRHDDALVHIEIEVALPSLVR